jgi:uncharacterized protein
MIKPVFCVFWVLPVLLASAAAAAERRPLRVGHAQFSVEVVTRPEAQRLGLGNRDHLADGRGMLFLYDSTGEHIFWMKGMRFAIDILWIRSGRLVYILEDIQPPSPLLKDRFLEQYGQGIQADMVLELPAGTTREASLKIGDPVILLP